MPGDGYTNQIWNTICGKKSDEEMWCSYQKLKKELWFCFDKQKIGYWVNKSLLSHLTLADDLALPVHTITAKEQGKGFCF